MNLQYNILWIEDEQEWVDSEVKFIKDYLEDFGFILDYENPKKYEKLKFSKYDIIVVDFNLADGELGQDVIEKIRKEELYTEILFYSNDGELKLRKIIADKKGIDGIYCASKDNCGEKLKKLIYTTIRKTQDLNNLRGLVMAETSELDEMMRKILELLFTQEKIEKEIIIGRKESAKKFHSAKLKDLSKEKYNLPENFLEFLNSRYFSSYSFFKGLQRFSESTKNNIDFKNFKNYKSDIIDERNNLAHNPEGTSTSEKMIILKDGKEIPYDEAKFKGIRQDIQKYKEIFQEIIQNLNS